MNTKEKAIRRILAILCVAVIFATIPISTAFANSDTKASTTTTMQTTASGCKDDKHSMPTGNIGKWFNSRSEVDAYFSSTCSKWLTKLDNGTITVDEYIKNCPQGYKAWSCSKCGKWTGDFTYGEAPTDPTTEPPTSHTHTWDNGVITKPATCTENGVKTYTCSGCGKTKTETITKTGHDYKYVANFDGTHKKICEKCSYEVTENCNIVKEGICYVCSDCGYVYEVQTELPTSHTHSWNNGVIIKLPTCTEEGVKTYTCNTCGETRTEAIAETGHTYVATVIKPTCTTNGKTVYKCANCNSSYETDYVEAIGHDYKYIANNDGTHKKICNNCSDTVIENCSKVKQDNCFVCSYCKAVYDDVTVTEPSTAPVTKPNPTEPSTNEPTKPSDPVTSPNESTTNKGNTDVTSALKGENKATTKVESGTTDSVNKNTDKKSPNTGAEVIDTGDNAPMNIIILCASAVLIVLAVVLMLKAKQNNKSGKFEP